MLHPTVYALKFILYLTQSTFFCDYNTKCKKAPQRSPYVNICAVLRAKFKIVASY